MNVSILICTYCDREWEQLAITRALPSTEGQGAHEVICCHQDTGTLASARNAAAATATGDWLCFLDADDELAPGYLNRMRAALAQRWVDSAGYIETNTGPQYVRNAELVRPAMFAPAVQFVTPQGRRYRPSMPTKSHCGGDIRRGSWLVIGTLVMRNLFEAAGGFREYAVYEDWALFASIWKLGAEIVEVPEAVYRAHIRRDSRNRAPRKEDREAVHWQITADLFPELLPPKEAVS